MKVLGLDIGDVWVGTALTDALGMFARPYQTVQNKNLIPFLRDLFTHESIEKIIIGHPKTMKGTSSEQTKKVEEFKLKLEQEFPEKKFLLWDERLSSKRADMVKKAQSKEDKIKSHSIAAAFILENYLQFTRISEETL